MTCQRCAGHGTIETTQPDEKVVAVLCPSCGGKGDIDQHIKPHLSKGPTSLPKPSKRLRAR